MQTKNVPAQIKATGDDSLQPGQFTAVVSVFNTVDSVGDVVMPGAFKADLEAWAVKGSPLPVVWSHDWSDPFSHIGHVLEAKETETGLQVKGQLDLDNPKAKQVYNLLKGGRVRNWSFAYDIHDAQQGQRDGKSVQELHRLSVHEVGPTLVGAHKDTDTVAVKSQLAAQEAPQPAAQEPVEAKADDPVISRLTAALDHLDADLKSAEVDTKAAPPGFTPKPIVARIRKLVAAAQALLDAVEPSTTDDSKAKPAQPSQPEPPAVAAPGPDPVRHGTALSRLQSDFDLFWAEIASHTI